MYPGKVQKKPKEIYNYINNIIGWPIKTDELNEEQIYLIKAYY
jgi:hypothetical protein